VNQQATVLSKVTGAPEQLTTDAQATAVALVSSLSSLPWTWA
jgi:hypothetical protein